MCNAYNLRHRNEAILDIARAMQLAVADLPDFPPRHRIGIKQRGLIHGADGGEELARISHRRQFRRQPDLGWAARQAWAGGGVGLARDWSARSAATRGQRRVE